MKLYFGDTTTTVTTISILVLIAFIVAAVLTRATIQHWGLKSLILVVFGLFICCYAATRDGLDKTIQNAIDGSCAPGLFPLVSVPTIIGCIGAIAIIVAAVATPIARSQHAREVWFYVMSAGVSLKILTVEISRVIIH